MVSRPKLIRPRAVTVALVLSLIGQFAAIFSIFILSVGMELHVGLLAVPPETALLLSVQYAIIGRVAESPRVD